MSFNSSKDQENRSHNFEYDPSLCSRMKPLPPEYQSRNCIEKNQKKRRRDDDQLNGARRRSRQAFTLDMNRQRDIEELLASYSSSSTGRCLTSSQSTSFEPISGSSKHVGTRLHDTYMEPFSDTVLGPRFVDMTTDSLPGCSRDIIPRTHDTFEEYPEWNDCMGPSGLHDPRYDQLLGYSYHMERSAYTPLEPRPGCSKQIDTGYLPFEPIPGPSTQQRIVPRSHHGIPLIPGNHLMERRFQGMSRDPFDDIDDDDDSCDEP